MRRKDREVTDMEKILQIIDHSQILHLGLFAEGYPYVVPMHYGYAYEDGRLTFYLHSAKEDQKLDLIQENPHVCVELETNVALVSGGDVPCKYGAAFSSVIGTGTAQVVEDPQEKIKGLKLLMLAKTRKDFEINERMADSVAVIKKFLAEAQPVSKTFQLH